MCSARNRGVSTKFGVTSTLRHETSLHVGWLREAPPRSRAVKSAKRGQPPHLRARPGRRLSAMASVTAFARLAVCLLLIAAAASAVAPFTLTSWRLSSSASFPRDVHHNVEKELSTTDSPLYGKPVWYNATGPATVMAALQQSNTFKDPYHADNILKINASMFAVPWYYSTVCTDRSLSDLHSCDADIRPARREDSHRPFDFQGRELQG